VATARLTADDRPDGHAHRTPAEPSRPKQLSSELVNRACAHAHLASRDADIVDPH
jgi:hypothetical protein